MGQITKLKKNTLISTVGNSLDLNEIKSNGEVISFSKDILVFSFNEIRELLIPFNPCSEFKTKIHHIPINENFMSAILSIEEFNKKILFKFIYVYCLGVERKYYSELFHHLMDEQMHYIEYLSKYYSEPWSVNDYAEKLGVSIRTLNNIFYDKFCVSTKQWIIEKRIQRGRELLMTSDLKISDIAMNCGFSNHAHFSELYRKTYGHSPKKLRLSSVKKEFLNKEDRVGV